MAEGLRARSKRKPSYYEEEGFEDDEELEVEEELDDDDDSPSEYYSVKSSGVCNVCRTGGRVLCCDTCSAVYHLECLDPPLKSFPRNSWTCAKCAEPLADIEKFLDCRTSGGEDSDNPPLKEYLVKWKSRSYTHCSWIALGDIERASKILPGLRMKLNHFNKSFDSPKSFLEDDQPAIRPEWLIVDRIINRRTSGDRDEYLVKWKDLTYDEATWEDEDLVASAQTELDRYHAIVSRGPKKAYYRRKGIGQESIRKKNFVAFDDTPSFLSGGTLHPYQLEGLNFLRFARTQEKHVILADEMGLGKTIQSIAFLASLAEEGVCDPHLVVAPLSTLRNWEREFATWAPHMNTVVYVGSSQARGVIREHEFYYPKKKDKNKRRHQDYRKIKQDLIKFDVLLTSYEMINLDTSVLKPIRWDCLIVDEGHRLKSKDSKLFQTLQNYTTFHRVLLTGTPLQNNLDELFTLMHFLDDSKFSSLEEFQQEFRDINQEEQVGRLHKMLSAHLLRRVKKDVLKQLPPKRELIMRVELSPIQKEYYKAILTRNYEVLSRKGGPQISLNNVVMELRKVCGHPYLLEGVEPENIDEESLNRQRIEASGKLALLDKMMVKLKANGHRVLIYSQFQRVLDILEDWLSVKKWIYERIDGSVSGAERQIRIDRFNAPNSNRFCFLLSTRAGGLGINLATADTVVIYDSDWNPHADLQAMARAHRLGQKNMVMIYRLITRNSIEERMMQMTKKKMVLEHLVVGRMKTQVLNQEELNDILTYGAKELFTDDNDDRQIHYDDAAIDRLLDRSLIGNEETPVNEEDNDLLKAFKVANFEYVNDANEAPEKEAEPAEAHTSDFWENLLKERYESERQEPGTQEMGKGKRSRKQVYRENVDDDLAGMDYVSSEDEDGDEVEDYNPPNDTSAKRPRKKPKVESYESSVGGPSPLMEGEGKNLKVLGFKRKHRALFVQILMRFGLGDFSWSAFVPHFKHKALEEITEYGTLFMTHITEDNTDSAFFSDGVPKEGLRIHDVFIRLAVLHLIGIKLKQVDECPGGSLFAEAAYAKYGGLRMQKFWREEHDLRLLRAIAQHGYGRWVDILEDPQYSLQEPIRLELMLPPTNNLHYGMSNGTSDTPREDDLGLREAEAHAWKKIIEFVKKRISLLEGALNTEFHLDDQEGSAPAQMGYDSHHGMEPEIEAQPMVYEQERPAAAAPAGASGYVAAYPIPIAPEEVSATTLDDDPKRLELVQIYNQMCSVLAENRVDAFQTYVGNKSAGVRLRKCIRQVDVLSSQMRRCLGAKAAQQPASSSEDKEDRPSNGHHTGDTDMNTSDNECHTSNRDEAIPQPQLEQQHQPQPVVILD